MVLHPKGPPSRWCNLREPGIIEAATQTKSLERLLDKKRWRSVSTTRTYLTVRFSRHRHALTGPDVHLATALSVRHFCPMLFRHYATLHHQATKSSYAFSRTCQACRIVPQMKHRHRHCRRRTLRSDSVGASTTRQLRVYPSRVSEHRRRRCET